jgi:tyrosine-protein phosphatase YwqE
MSSSVWGWIKDQFSSAKSTVPASPCFWQTDVHSHLIAGVDDGVKSTDDALTCIRTLAGWGIKRVITTPHISQDYFPNDAVTLQKGRDVLQQQVDLAGIPIQIDVAAEYMLDDFFLERLEQGPLLSFGAERFVLVEMSALARPFLLDEMFFRIQTEGYIPVLAHPERYHSYYSDFEALVRIRERGCLLQLNWMSLLGRYGPQAKAQAQLILKYKCADLIGSDMHRPSDLSTMEALFTSPFYEQLSQQPLRNSSL